MDEGIELLRMAAPVMAPGGLWARGQLGHYLGRKGDRSGAEQVLAELVELRKSGYVSPIAIAAVHAGDDQIIRRRQRDEAPEAVQDADPTIAIELISSNGSVPTASTSFSKSRFGGGSFVGIPRRRLAYDSLPDDARKRACSSVAAATTLTPRIE